MKQSKKIFSILNGATVTGALKKPLTLLTDDSRCVIPGCCYIAVKGTRFDGHTAIAGAIEAGAVAIVAETPCTEQAERAERGIH